MDAKDLKTLKTMLKKAEKELDKVNDKLDELDEKYPLDKVDMCSCSCEGCLDNCSAPNDWKSNKPFTRKIEKQMNDLNDDAHALEFFIEQLANAIDRFGDL